MSGRDYAVGLFVWIGGLGAIAGGRALGLDTGQTLTALIEVLILGIIIVTCASRYPPR